MPRQSGMHKEVSSTVKERNRLVDQYRAFVQRVAKSMICSMNLPPKLYEEMIAAGYLGLVEAAERFEQGRGKDFRSYAYLRIRGSIIDSIRSSSELSGRAYKKARAYLAALDLREAVGATLHEEMGGDEEASLAKILDYVADNAFIFRLSLSDVEKEVVAITDEGPNPEEQLESQQSQDELQRLVEMLPEKERMIIEEYYFREKAFVDIADASGTMSKSWISRLHARALRRLREMLYEREMAD